MNIAFCYDQVFPARGGCGTYIPDLARRLTADGHEVHLLACSWDEAALGPGVRCHRLPTPRGPRFLRPWRFSTSCLDALRHTGHDVSVGFDKTWGQDVLYPQGGLHAASVEHNFRKFASPAAARLARWGKALDVAHWSFVRLERRQYQGSPISRQPCRRVLQIGDGELRSDSPVAASMSSACPALVTMVTIRRESGVNCGDSGWCSQARFQSGLPVSIS